jgi:hypothetical protein
MYFRTAWVLVLAVGIGFCSLPNAAEALAPTVDFYTNGSEITLKIEKATLREVFARIFEGGETDWPDQSSADELISGEYRGTIDRIVTSLLDRYNFIISYKNDGETLRIARVRVIGRKLPAATARNNGAEHNEETQAKEAYWRTEEDRKRLRVKVLWSTPVPEAQLRKRFSAFPVRLSMTKAEIRPEAHSTRPLVGEFPTRLPSRRPR